MIMVYYKECSILKLFTLNLDMQSFSGFVSLTMSRLHFDFSSLSIVLSYLARDWFHVFLQNLLSCHSAGVVVEEGVVAVVLTEVVVVEADLEGVEVVAEVDLTDIKTMVHRNML